jgi:very-short-patch-repair endonuclease
MDASDLTTHRGVRVTTPVRTVIDLSASLSEWELKRLLGRAMTAHRIGPLALTRSLARLAPRRGVAKLRRVMATNLLPTRSELELVVLQVLMDAGFEEPLVNEAIRVEGRWWVPDFRWPRERLVLEADGARWHGNALARADDRERQRVLESAGEQVLRTTWHQAVTEPGRLAHHVRAAGAPLQTRSKDA